jgi:hypothetical protein
VPASAKPRFCPPAADRPHLGAPIIVGKATVKRPAKDPVREERIHEEAIVDAYGQEEKAMSWYCYLRDKLTLPFKARYIAHRLTSPLRKGETVEVRRTTPEDACSSDMFVRIRWQGRNLALPFSQLIVIAIEPDEETADAVGDWHYWVANATCSENSCVPPIYAALPMTHTAPTSSIAGSGRNSGCFIQPRYALG